MTYWDLNLRHAVNLQCQEYTVTQSSIPGVLRAKTTIKIFSLASIGERKVNASLGFPFGGRLCELN